jgi:hypothetical protein
MRVGGALADSQLSGQYMRDSLRQLRRMLTPHLFVAHPVAPTPSDAAAIDAVLLGIEDAADAVAAGRHAPGAPKHGYATPLDTRGHGHTAAGPPRARELREMGRDGGRIAAALGRTVEAYRTKLEEMDVAAERVGGGVGRVQRAEMALEEHQRALAEARHKAQEAERVHAEEVKAREKEAEALKAELQALRQRMQPRAHMHHSPIQQNPAVFFSSHPSGPHQQPEAAAPLSPHRQEQEDAPAPWYMGTPSSAASPHSSGSDAFSAALSVREHLLSLDADIQNLSTSLAKLK